MTLKYVVALFVKFVALFSPPPYVKVCRIKVLPTVQTVHALEMIQKKLLCLVCRDEQSHFCSLIK